MHPIYITLAANVPLVIVSDGHPVLADTYYLYYNRHHVKIADFVSAQNDFSWKKEEDPNYLGQIIFAVPDKLFEYYANGKQRINSSEVEEIIELVSQYRDSPENWSTC